MTRECPHCGGELDKRGRARRGWIDARCIECDDVFRQRNENHRYCSRACQVIAYRRESSRPMVACEKCGLMSADIATHICRYAS